MTMSQSDLDKEDEEEGLEDSSLQPGQSLLADKEESPRKKVKLWLSLKLFILFCSLIVMLQVQM